MIAAGRGGMTELIGLAVVLFAATNLDDLFVLLAFFADPRFAPRQIVLGQYLGMSCLLAASVAVSLVSLTLSREQLGLSGLVPILIGLKRLHDLWRGGAAAAGADRGGGGHGAMLSVAAVTVANGGDNIGVYAPVVATRSTGDLALIAAVFAGLTALWLAFGYGLVGHPRLGAPIRRHGPRVVPFVLIGIGAMILHEGGSLHLVARLF